MKEGVIIIPVMHIMNLKTREVKIPKIYELISIREPVYEPRKSVCRGHALQSLFLEVCRHNQDRMAGCYFLLFTSLQF